MKIRATTITSPALALQRYRGFPRGGIQGLRGLPAGTAPLASAQNALAAVLQSIPGLAEVLPHLCQPPIPWAPRFAYDFPVTPLEAVADLGKPLTDFVLDVFAQASILYGSQYLQMAPVPGMPASPLVPVGPVAVPLNPKKRPELPEVDAAFIQQVERGAALLVWLHRPDLGACFFRAFAQIAVQRVNSVATGAMDFAKIIGENIREALGAVAAVNGGLSGVTFPDDAAVKAQVRGMLMELVVGLQDALRDTQALLEDLPQDLQQAQAAVNAALRTVQEVESRFQSAVAAEMDVLTRLGFRALPKPPSLRGLGGLSNVGGSLDANGATVTFDLDGNSFRVSGSVDVKNLQVIFSLGDGTRLVAGLPKTRTGAPDFVAGLAAAKSTVTGFFERKLTDVNTKVAALATHARMEIERTGYPDLKAHLDAVQAEIDTRLALIEQYREGVIPTTVRPSTTAPAPATPVKTATTAVVAPMRTGTSLAIKGVGFVPAALAAGAGGGGGVSGSIISVLGIIAFTAVGTCPVWGPVLQNVVQKLVAQDWEGALIAIRGGTQKKMVTVEKSPRDVLGHPLRIGAKSSGGAKGSMAGVSAGAAGVAGLAGLTPGAMLGVAVAAAGALFLFMGTAKASEDDVYTSDGKPVQAALAFWLKDTPLLQVVQQGGYASVVEWARDYNANPDQALARLHLPPTKMQVQEERRVSAKGLDLQELLGTSNEWESAQKLAKMGKSAAEYADAADRDPVAARAEADATPDATEEDFTYGPGSIEDVPDSGTAPPATEPGTEMTAGDLQSGGW